MTRGGGQAITFVDDRDKEILQHIARVGNYRLSPGEVATGIDVHQDFVSSKHLQKLKGNTIKKGDGIFILSDKEKNSIHLSSTEMAIVKPYYTTTQLYRYYGNPKNELWVIYTDSKVVKHITDFPHIKAHLDKFASVITSDNRPYGLHRSRNEKFFLGEKIISLRKTDRPHFTYTDFPCYVSQTFFVLKPTGINLKYLTAILNSSLCHFWLDKKGKKQGEALQVDKEPLLKIPIYTINTSNPSEKKQHDDLASLVSRMLDLHKRLNEVKTPQEKSVLERQIEATDDEINRLVYKLYGLTEDEVRIVEGS